MRDYLREMWSGSGGFRFFVQPAVALTLGVIDGLRDAREGRPPYLLDLLRESGRRTAKLRTLLKRLAVPLVVGVTLSVVFQMLNRGTVIWSAAVGFGVFLIAAPYVAARAGSNRLARWRGHRRVRI